jgi:hypothetical protein
MTKFTIFKKEFLLTEEGKKKYEEYLKNKEEEKKIREEKTHEDKGKWKEELIEIEKRQKEYIKKFILEHSNCNQKLINRFFSKVNIKGEDECWEWVGAKNKDYYGNFYYKSYIVELSHRISWRICYGKIPKDKEVIMHLCNNPSCVNPKHLKAGTHLENANQMLIERRGNKASGEDNGNSRYSYILINQIRSDFMKGLSPKQISDKYKIPYGTIDHIIHNGTWFNEEYQKWLDTNYIPIYNTSNKSIESYNSAKLTWKEVKEIREKYSTGKYTHEMLAKDYHISKSTISDIIRNKTWIIH